MVLASGPVPTPKPDEVLIRVQAVGVNRPDVAQRAGSYPPPPGASPVLGLEASGEVVELGRDVTACSVGDRVCALANGGAYAEYVVAPAGESALIHGGSSGIGVTAIQLARAFGATVYATAGSDEKCAACEKLGAAHAINYRNADFGAEIKRLTEGRGVDVVLDMVGAPYFPRNLRALALEGRLVQIAFLQGSKLEALDLMPIMMRRLTVTGSTMRPRSTAQKGRIADALRAKVWPKLAEGLCPPVIHSVFPLAEAAAAHRLMESSAHIGKIMLTVAP
jgi:NADPH2:quinone reductase